MSVKGRRPGSRRAQDVARDRGLGNLATLESVQKLQRALHAKAKEAPDYRFYALYDKVYREDILAHAYHCCRANGGAGGVDGVGFASIEAYGVQRWLGELAEELKSKSYRPEAVRRVYIPKPNGALRPLGIPTVRDRVVQTAAVLVLGPIFEADMAEEQYAYRPGRNALDAVKQVHRLMNTGHTEVIDADLSGYFDSIPHAELMTSVARRVSDKHLLHLIKMWLEAPVEEDDGRGHKRKSTQSRDRGRGIPQGAPISPLLANLYMRRFVLGWKRLGYERRFGARIVNYADDLVILCRGRAQEALVVVRTLVQRLKLTVNEDKTRVCHLPEERFEFLGYNFGRCYSTQTGQAYLGTRPARKSIWRLITTISACTERRHTVESAAVVVERINRRLRGWANYFCLGPVSKAYRAIDRHTTRRLRRWLRVKHQLRGACTTRYPDAYLYQELGLLCLSHGTRTFPWAKA